MKTINLTILEEDILKNNYFSSDECPITKALHRAGYPNLKDIGSIVGQDNSGNIIDLQANSESPYFNSSYRDLLIKLFGMYQNVEENDGYTGVDDLKVPALPVETFTHTITY